MKISKLVFLVGIGIIYISCAQMSPLAPGKTYNKGSTLVECTQLSTAEALQQISETPYAAFCLAADIHLAPDWTPINWFSGILDGKSNSISGLNIDQSTRSWQGLFDVLGSSALVRDLTIEAPTIVGDSFVGSLAGVSYGSIEYVTVSGAQLSGTNYVGALVGENLGSITNSHASGRVTGTTNRVGGLIGENDGLLKGSSANVTVEGDNLVGGLAGISFAPIESSSASGTVTGSGPRVGGLVGLSQNIITNSHASGVVKGSSAVGGLVGENYDSVKASYAKGSVTGDRLIGGLVGINNSLESIESSSESIENSYASGAVTGTTSIGGLVGINNNSGSIKNSYASGAVTGTAKVGGLTGVNLNTITNSYFDTETTKQNTAIGEHTGTADADNVKGYTKADIRTDQEFSSWDFITIWEFRSGNWPTLRAFE